MSILAQFLIARGRKIPVTHSLSTNLQRRHLGPFRPLSTIGEWGPEKSLQFIKKAQDNIVSQITSAALKRRPLQMQKRKAIAITTYVPKFQEGYSHDRRYDPDRERAENAKVRSQFKKEQKGAERELRKDSAFVARQQLQDTKEKDAAYKKKMDKIMGQLSSQEGAMRGVERTSKKPKRKH
ncbi:hypothetical protein BASA62_004602 [Batrachochytrium salamandrivorans]|nr:hypothetical protein BASA62_004602 [Batrachochytrium salamandrivorans]